MRFLHSLVPLLLGLAAPWALAWGNHSAAAYRAFEVMPEVTNAPVVVAETLESFLRAEENTVEALLASQEAWALANIDKYPVRPAALAFKADAARNDEARRLAFLRALRIAPDSKLALYYQTDPWNAALGTPLPFNAVSTMAEEPGTGYKFMALRPGDTVTALTVLATACDEPDFGLDLFVWEDSPSDWGKQYGFGAQPYGNPLLAHTAQTSLHTAFMHEGRLVSAGVFSLKRSLLQVRAHQYATLSSLAFRTGHAYWGWRFAGMALHYLQDLTQPYNASLAPGESASRLLSARALALAAMPGMQNDLLALQANRRQLLEKYQTELLQRNAAARQETALEKALRNTDKDKNYPDWTERSLREVISLQASRAAPAMAQALVAAMPAAYVSDPDFDFAAHQASINLLSELPRSESAERARLDASVAEWLGNFGAHSRAGLRGILRASEPY